MMHKRTKFLNAICIILLGIALAFIASYSFVDKQVPASYLEPIRPISDVKVSVGDGEPAEVSLPVKLSGLAPRTPVTMTATVRVHPGDSLRFKSVFAPVRLYIDGAFTYESGQPGSYPPYMNDPPTILTNIPLPDKDGATELRVEYLSPNQRNELSLPVLFVGNEAALLVSQFRVEGFSLLFSLMLISLGLGMMLVSVTVIRVDHSGAFLWLGLSSLSAGVWVLGECDLTAFLLPYPTLLYNMAYLGLFLVTIPFLCFGLAILHPKSRLPFQIMLGVHTVSVAIALILQLSGRMDFTKSLYWFHIIIPLGFLIFTICLLWEHFRHHNPAAKKFAPAVILMVVSVMGEVLNYWLRLTNTLTVFFQLGVLAFVVSLCVINGCYVGEFLRTVAEKVRLEYEISTTTRQLSLQRLQYQKMAENDEAVKAQRHDLRHQLAVLRELSVQGDMEKLSEYLDTLIRKIPSDRELRLCENYAVNAIAAYYTSAAKEQNIKVDLLFAVPAELEPMTESDLCIIVGNLLENAVEACGRMTKGSRFIQLQSHLEYGILTITVDNSFNGMFREKNGVFLSSKRDGEGTGLSSVAAVAKKYGGTARFEAKNGVFQASVYVRITSESNKNK